MFKDTRALGTKESREVFQPRECDSGQWVAVSRVCRRESLGSERYQGQVIECQLAALRRMIAALGRMAHHAGMDAEVSGRIKSFGSIWRKMRDRRMFYRDVSDAVGVRMVVPSEDDCYRLIESIQQRFELVNGRQRDYIANPKANGYRSLHTTVRDDRRVPVEIQLRTPSMHLYCEHGPAAHRSYKLTQDARDLGEVDHERRA